jgi:hypothetical protein
MKPIRFGGIVANHFPMRTLLLFSFLALMLRAQDAYVPFRADLPAGSGYTIDVRQLHPTQMALGWREVVAKKQLIEAKSPAALLAYLKGKDVPIVIGPGGVPYMTDGHHTMRALLESRVPDKITYGHILANWADVSPAEFWTRMQAKKYVYLNDAAGRGPQAVSALPATLADMQRDPYRGLGWGVMKAGGFDEKPGVFFQEFLWGDRLRDKISWDDRDDAAFARAVKEACVLAQTPAFADLPGYKGTLATAESAGNK